MVFTLAGEFAAEIATLCATEITHGQSGKLLDLHVPLVDDRALDLGEVAPDDV
jgi:hypothetical protein